MKLIQKGVRER